ncbi:Uncharacterised protein [Corynebacterium renale]|nr:Uncharacterised protein [Corynebacterium renale]
MLFNNVAENHAPGTAEGQERAREGGAPGKAPKIVFEEIDFFINRRFGEAIKRHCARDLSMRTVL